MNNLIVHINRTNFLEVESKEYKQQYQRNLSYWAICTQRKEVNEILISEMTKSNIDFWCQIENLNPYKRPNMIMISTSLNYVGTNRFYGYVSKDFYNSLLETFTN